MCINYLNSIVLFGIFIVIFWIRGIKKNRRDIYNVDFIYLSVYMNFFF